MRLSGTAPANFRFASFDINPNTGSCVLVSLLARRLFQRETVTRWAVALAALYGPLVYYDLPAYRPFWSAVEELGVPFYLHPRLQPLKALLDLGEAAIMPGVGYTPANQSRFRSMDIWMTGSEMCPTSC